MSAIHAAGKLHRDLKPSNVLVTAQGRVVILDFGLTIALEPGGVGQTLRDHRIAGTPAYLAPEQIMGMHPTTSSDFYALGVMLFEALCGELPFAGPNLLVDKQRLDAPPVRSLQPNAPADLAAVCDRLLLRDPAARPSAEQLRALLADGHTSATLAQVRALPPGRALMGRKRELARLRHAFESTTRGRTVVLCVTGESGIGKSALVAEFLE